MMISRVSGQVNNYKFLSGIHWDTNQLRTVAKLDSFLSLCHPYVRKQYRIGNRRSLLSSNVIFYETFMVGSMRMASNHLTNDLSQTISDGIDIALGLFSFHRLFLVHAPGAPEYQMERETVYKTSCRVNSGNRAVQAGVCRAKQTRNRNLSFNKYNKRLLNQLVLFSINENAYFIVFKPEE